MNSFTKDVLNKVGWNSDGHISTWTVLFLIILKFQKNVAISWANITAAWRIFANWILIPALFEFKVCF